MNIFTYELLTLWGKKQNMQAIITETLAAKKVLRGLKRSGSLFASDTYYRKLTPANGLSGLKGSVWAEEKRLMMQPHEQLFFYGCVLM